MIGRRIAVLVALVAAACGGDDGIDSGCYGVAPLIEDCARGYFFAECGGAGEPRLGCRDGGRCYWFTGGCVAQGFTASDCQADAICCHHVENYGPEAYFPFERDDAEGFEYPLAERIFGLGRKPWDRTRAMDLDVVVDPTLVSAPTAWTCEGSAFQLSSVSTPCDAQTETSASLGATLTILSQYTNFFGWNPVVEIDLDAGTARLCADFYTDANAPVCGGGGAVCADAGTITISRTPASGDDLVGIMMNVDVSFYGGAYLFRGTTTVGR